MTKLIIMCCGLSFICGMFVVVLVEKNKGCTVTYKHGDQVHVLIGRK